MWLVFPGMHSLYCVHKTNSKVFTLQEQHMNIIFLFLRNLSKMFCNIIGFVKNFWTTDCRNYYHREQEITWYRHMFSWHSSCRTVGRTLQTDLGIVRKCELLTLWVEKRLVELGIKGHAALSTENKTKRKTALVEERSNCGIRLKNHSTYCATIRYHTLKLFFLV